MAKKKKKKKKAASDKTLSDDLLLKYAQDSLDSGKFRKARDYFKVLCNRDREKYTPGLAAAYQGLFDELMEKGQTDNAKVILANLEKIRGEKEHPAWVRLNLKQGDFSEAGRIAVRCLLNPEHDFSENAVLLADALVVSFDRISGHVDSLPSFLATDLRAICAAVMHVSEGEHEQALAVMGPVGIKSLFAHWKLFLKGLCSFYRGEHDKARKALGKLPEKSVPANAAEPYLLLMEGPGGLKNHFKDYGLLKKTCFITGLENLGEVLPRAEYLWRVGRYRDSYKQLRDNMADFPSDRPGILQTLSLFYFNSILHMDERKAESFLAFLFETIGQKRRINLIEQLLLYRTESLYIEKIDGDDKTLTNAWEDFIGIYERNYGEHQNLKALLYAHLGDIFSVVEPDFDPFRFFYSAGRRKTSRLRNRKLAEKCYKTSLKLNWDDRDTHFCLFRLYEKTTDKSRANRKIDEIIKLFPDDKEALFCAGLRCVDRKAFNKGMKYLERALEMDPLDSVLKEQFVLACIETALRYAEKSEVVKFRDLLPKAIAYASGPSNHFNLGAPFLYARWSVFELLAGQEENARGLMDRAMSMSDNPFKMQYFTLLMAKVYGVDERRCKKLDQETRVLLSGGYAPEKAVSLAEVIGYLGYFPATGWLKEESIRTNAFILNSIQLHFSKDQIRTIVDYALSGPTADQALAEKYIEKGLKSFPEDPFFLFCRFNLKFQNKPSIRPSEKDVKQLQRILSLAEQQRDFSLASGIRECIGMVEDMMTMPVDFDPFDDAEIWDDGFDEEFDPPFSIPSTRHPRKKSSSKKRKKDKKTVQGTQLNLFD